MSDRCSRGEAKDTSGPNLVKLVTQAQKYDIIDKILYYVLKKAYTLPCRLTVTDEQVITQCVPDNISEIQVIPPYVLIQSRTDWILIITRHLIACEIFEGFTFRK